MARLKSNMLVGAALRYAAAEFIDCVLVRRGDADAGAIFLHIDALDGRHKVLARKLEYDANFDGEYRWSAITGDAGDAWVDQTTAEAKLARELEIDPDVFVIAVCDARARNPFEML